MGRAMPDAEQSYQQLDPIGGYSTRPVTLLMSLGIFVYAVVATVWSWADLTVPAFAAAALVACAASCLGAVYWSSSLRAPFSRAGYVMVVALGAIAMILISLSTWGGTTIIGWGPIVVGLIILQLGPYRPSRDLLAATLLAAIVGGFVIVMRPNLSQLPTPELVTILEAILPLVALGLASRAYAIALGRNLVADTPALAQAERAATDELRADILRSVQHDRVSILNQRVVPFLTDVLERNTVTAEDRERASVIAESIRSLMVADVDRSWLDSVIDQAGRDHGNAALPGSEVVQDDHHIAGSMTPKQRSIVRALLVALFAHPGFDPDGFGILLLREGPICVFTLSAKLDHEDSILRSGLGVYFAVLRIVFPDLQLTFEPPTLTLKFSYDHK